MLILYELLSEPLTDEMRTSIDRSRVWPRGSREPRSQINGFIFLEIALPSTAEYGGVPLGLLLGSRMTIGSSNRAQCL